MKKIILILLVISSLNSALAQNQGERFKRIKALKTAFITDRLELSPSEAEKFWPVYNKYEAELNELEFTKRRRIHIERTKYESFDAISNTEAKKLLTSFQDIKMQTLKKEGEKMEDLSKIISPQQMLKLIKAEDDFRKELFKMLRERKGKRF